MNKEVLISIRQEYTKTEYEILKKSIDLLEDIYTDLMCESDDIDLLKSYKNKIKEITKEFENLLIDGSD